MSTIKQFTEKHLRQIRDKGIAPSQIEEQLDRFEHGFPSLDLDRPATVGDGIVRIPEEDQKQLLERFYQARNEGRIMKFVPASGAASRMFKTLQAMLNSEEKLTKTYFKAHPNDSDVVYTRTFLDHLETFAFYEDLEEVLTKQALNVRKLRDEGDYRTLISYVLENRGLGLASLPKALIPFHRYPDHRRTPLEEHLVEAAEYTRGKNGNVRIHFTVSPEHESAFQHRLKAVRGRYETHGTRFQVETSFQKPETDTIAADEENRPFLDENGELMFRAGGHGALLANLEELKGDIVFIKNIDNVVPDRLKEPTYLYKKLIGGYLLTLQDRINFYLKELDRGNTQTRLLEEIIRFMDEELHIDLPQHLIQHNKSTNTSEIVRRLFGQLNRPVRVCGMVKNEGEPGGGPFIIQEAGGTTSLQIVEKDQVDMDDPEQKRIFESSTHFNPVDIACSLRDYQGRSFSLESFRDPETGFISKKSYQGRDLKALELPGLWNGSMALWITVFVEVPPETFSPVKTVNDLLRKEHRNEE